MRIKIEKKALNESTLTAMLNDPRSAFLTLHQETLQGEQGRPLLMCKPKKIYLLYANNSINESKSITEIFLDNVIIKGGYISSEKFSDCLSFCSPEVPLTLPILSEDIDLASMLNLISSGKAVSFVPEGFLKFCEEGISSVVMNNITMMPKILCVGNGRKYFEEVAEFINSY